MPHEILVNITPQETRVAILENGVLQELFVERANRRGLVGNIYKSKVIRVMPGMDAAFVDIGLDKAAFLHVSDIEMPTMGDVVPDQQAKRLPITQILREGQELLVQVVKDPLGSKGPRVTTQLTIPSRYLVLLPSATAIGVSTKIENDEQRQTLRAIMENARPPNSTGGYIVRTVAENASTEELQRDALFLQKIGLAIHERSKIVKPPGLVHEDLPLALRTLRDIVDGSVDSIIVDSKESFVAMREFSAQYMPDMQARISHYSADRPLFDMHSVEDEIQKAMERKVVLKSGGYLIIDQTEAMTTVDVNTGGFVGSRNLEETIYKTNLEAAQAIARQLRLRNLGGIIIIDFIDMLDEEHKRQVLRALGKALEKDHARTHVSEVSELGLVEMTRKRTRESLEHVLCEPCPACEGRGFVKTTETACYEIFREILRVVRQYDPHNLTVLASQAVVDLLLDEQSHGLAELEAFVEVPIRLQVEHLYNQAQYDVVMM
ncbi:MAG: ribonuclease G [Gammaproteobacteria bacterium]|nr:ribonuclease G [Gammaproteobacteria bacterium]